MPISYIENQPVLFGYEQTDCNCLLSYVQLVNFADITQFQLLIDACPDAVNIVPDGDFGVWGEFSTIGSGWSTSEDLTTICHTGDIAGSIQQTLLTIDKYYKIVITISGLVGTGAFIYGFVENIPIEGDGTFAFFAKSDATAFGITAPGNVSFCISGDLAIYEVNTGFLVQIYDNSSGSQVAEVSDDYFTLSKNTLTVSVPWEVLELPAGCYYIVVEDPCFDEVVSIRSNVFSLGDHSCTLLINGCNESDGLGFIFENSGFSPRVRLSARFSNPENPYSIDRLTDISSNGLNKNFYYSRRKNKLLVIDNEPIHIHDFISLCIGFHHLYIENLEYSFTETDYPAIRWDRLRCFGNTAFEIQETTQNIKSTRCAEPTESGCNLSS